MQETRQPSMRSNPEQSILREVARDMQVTLYGRYSEADAAKVLGLTEGELGELRAAGRIAYLRISQKAIGYFGYQLLTYLLDSAVPAGSGSKASPEATEARPRSASDAKAELVSVDEAMAMLGIGRTKFYELLQLNRVQFLKIGRRTLIKVASLRKYTGLEP